MILTAVLSIAGAALCAVGFALCQAGILLSLAITFGTIAYHFTMRLLVGLVFDRTMQNHADYTKAWYRQRAWEKKLYKTLRVKHWKDNLPTFNPQEFSMEHHSFGELAQAMCQAELVHEVCAALSFVPVLAARWFGALPVFLLTSIGGAGFDLLFVILQRYNRPRVLRLMRSGATIEDRKREEELR